MTWMDEAEARCRALVDGLYDDDKRTFGEAHAEANVGDLPHARSDACAWRSAR